MPRTLFDLNHDGSGLFDNSSSGLKITATGAVSAPTAGTTMTVATSTRIRVGRNDAVDALDEFTLEVTVNPDRLGRTQTIVDSQTPPVQITVDRVGVVTAAVHTERGWQKVTSRAKLKAGNDSNLRLVRSARGKLTLEVDGRARGSANAPGPLKAVGRAGISIGTNVAGDAGFAGSVGGVRLLDGAVTTSTLKRRITEANRLGRVLEGLYGVPGRVVIEEGEVDARFNTIKGVMHAAGVSDLSKLSTLTVTRRTTLTAGTILKAPSATQPTVAAGDWKLLASEFVRLSTTDTAAAKELVDSTLLSRSVGRAAALALTEAATSPSTMTPTPGTTGPIIAGPITSGPASGRPNLINTPTIPGNPTIARRRPGSLAADPRLRRRGHAGSGDADGANLGSIIARPALNNLALTAAPAITHVDGLERLERNAPDAWPIMIAQPLMFTSAVLPVDSAVIIAKRFDLTNQTLEIDPSVGTLYIIAEEVEAASGARITWKRSPISTPNIGNDASLDGRDRHGVDLAPNSKHGMPGGDARGGAPGIAGYHGQDAPNVEIWALRFNGMPDIDLEGQQGGRGGRGQRGGEGGNGAQGRSGEWFWAFGRRCWSGPGNGGDGGDGGDGGRGGRGGNGGDAGDITFAVLPETLTALTTTNSFTANLSGGDEGRGGEGGRRGEGGRGGPGGFTEVCSQARTGARGQPGRVGSEGPSGGEGPDGHMSIMTVTQESWDEQLTRPWLYDVTPNAAFPGTSVVLKGSRFADTDEVRIDGLVASSTLRADGGLDVTIPTTIGGGAHSIYLRRHDGEESNRLPLDVKPQLTGSLPDVVPGTPIEVTGRAFLDGATVEFDGDLYPTTFTSATALTFTVPESAGPVSGERIIGLAVVNPDGHRSNTLTGTIPQVLRNGFTIGVHDFSFDNDKDGRPSWSTFEDTYGAVEVWHELLDPIFGHPILTAGYYFFYEHFLKGEDNGGLATGFCTSLASMALDRFWQGNDDTFATVVRDTAFREQMTAIHGRLLSRESLLDFHDQGRRGNANVESTFREIEAIFETGGTRETAPMLFFVPAGAAWDAGYFDMLADSHCIVPIRIVYPVGYDGSSLDGVRMYCWDNNHSNNHECFVDFRVESGETLFHYTADGSGKFDSDDGITLAVSTLGEYLLRDVDLPFGGPLGLTTFVIDFLLSPATMQVVDDAGRMTGRVGGQILAEIPDSHPAYLVPNAYLLPKQVGLTRRITGTASGSYGYGSISPDGVSMSLADVPTQLGQTDRVLANADASRVRFVPADNKTVDLTLGRAVGDTARGVSIQQFAATPTDDLDVTATPDLSVVRVSNRGATAQVDVKLLGFDLPTEDRATLERGGVNVPSGHDLVIAVTDWDDLVDANVATTVVET